MAKGLQFKATKSRCVPVMALLVFESAVATAAPTGCESPREVPLPPLPRIECSQLPETMAKFGADMNTKDQVVFGYLDQVSSVAENLYNEFSPIENDQKTIPKGKSLELKKYSDGLRCIQEFAVNNTEILNQRLDQINAALRRCLNQAK